MHFGPGWINASRVILKTLGISLRSVRRDGLTLALAAGIFALSSAYCATPEPYWETAVKLLEVKDYPAALAELERLNRAYPRDSILLRLTGQTQALLGDSTAALRSLRAAVKADPQDQSARYFLAKAQAEAGEIPAAIHTLDELSSNSDATEYTREAALRMDQLRIARDRQRAGFDSPLAVLDTAAENPLRRWSATLRTGVKYDSNVPQRADSFPDLSPRASWGLYTAGFGSYDVISPAIDGTPFRLGVSASGYQLWYTEQSLTDYDVTGVSVRPYASYQGEAAKVPFQISIDGSWDVIWLGGSFYNRDFTASAAADVQWFKFLLTTVKYRYVNSQYDNDTQLPQYFSRDGGVHDASIGFTTFFFDDRFSIGAQYGITVFDTQGSQFQSVGNRVEMYTGIKLPWDFDLTLTGGFQSTGYYLFTPSPGRLDGIWTASSTIRRKIWKGLTAEVAYTFIGASSDQEFAEYTRNVVDFALIYEF